MATIAARVLKIQTKLSKAVNKWGTTVTRYRDVIDGIVTVPVQYPCIVDAMRISYLHPNSIDMSNVSSDNEDPLQFLFDWTVDIRELDIILYGGYKYSVTRIYIESPANIVVSKLAVGVRVI